MAGPITIDIVRCIGTSGCGHNVGTSSGTLKLSPQNTYTWVQPSGIHGGGDADVVAWVLRERVCPCEPFALAVFQSGPRAPELLRQSKR